MTRMGDRGTVNVLVCTSQSWSSGIKIQYFFKNLLPAVYKQMIDPPPYSAALLQDSRPIPDNMQRGASDSPGSELQGYTFFSQIHFREKRSAQCYRPH